MVRFVHVAAAVVLVGGAAAFALGSVTGGHAHVLAVRFEWAGWIALGALVASGIGNLAALDDFPSADSAWGVAFSLKLLALVLLAAVALIRTARLLVGPGDARVSRWPYVSTGGIGFVALALAQVMAHG